MARYSGPGSRQSCQDPHEHVSVPTQTGQHPVNSSSGVYHVVSPPHTAQLRGSNTQLFKQDQGHLSSPPEIPTSHAL